MLYFVIKKILALTLINIWYIDVIYLFLYKPSNNYDYSQLMRNSQCQFDDLSFLYNRRQAYQCPCVIFDFETILYFYGLNTLCNFSIILRWFWNQLCSLRKNDKKRKACWIVDYTFSILNWICVLSLCIPNKLRLDNS